MSSSPLPYRLLRFSGYVLLLFLLYFVLILGYGTLTDWIPEKRTTLANLGADASRSVLTDSTLTLLSWNVGYGGLGAEEAFFYDRGGFFWTDIGTARVPEERVNRYVDGMETTVSEVSADIYLLQEVDTSSRRSWYTDQLDSMASRLPDYASYFAMNYKNERVPIPVFQPWDHYGYVRGGLTTFSRYQPKLAERYQLPGDLAWPTRLFELDRCALRQAFSTDWGPEVVVYNVHLAAYDADGGVKKQQMKWLKEMIVQDYERGHYVIVGGDWNQVPPGEDYGKFSPDRRDEFSQFAIADDYAPPGWTWAYDRNFPTNRKSREIYRRETALKAQIDFYLLSPNVAVVTVEGIDQDFAYSDHQPVKVVVRLK